jgi:Fe-Mn family superoxide dismutase
LPYDYNALEPYIGEQTLQIHHGKHHAKYVATTNSMIAGTELEGADVVTILRKAYGTNQGLFNNAAQSYNHEFYWKCMKKGGGGEPTGKLADMINKAFGSFENFKKEFATAGNTAFGSGW